MTSSLDMWIEYLLRFSHLVAGIAWIGSSFYFIWLDSSFETPQTPKRNVEGELFMVHGGFYYQVEKRKIFPGELPKILHWFKWEATLTWITGFFLLIYVFYLNGASLLMSPNFPLTQMQVAGLSLGILVLSWFVYDLIWHPKFENYKPISTVISVFYFCGLIYLNTQVFSGRGAFIQTGAILGSLMLLNVWVRILPGQRRMVKDAENGKVPDYSMSLKSKIRSVHNTYFTFPVLFIMVSNHYPLVYNHPKNWLVLIVLAVSGALVRHAMVTKNKIERWTLLPAAFGLMFLLYLTAKTDLNTGSREPVSYQEVHAVFSSRCLQCHSSHPTDDIFKEPPKGLILETEAQTLAILDKLEQHVVIAKTMPLANKTGMTEDERALVAAWIKAINSSQLPHSNQ